MSQEKLYLKLTNQDLALFNEDAWQNDDLKEEYEFYKQVAIILIERHLNMPCCLDSELNNIELVFNEQIVLLSAHVYNIHSTIVANTQNQGIKQISSNGRSVTFMDALEIASQVAIPDYIKAMLPKPRARVRVW